jgi:hypothetical protein
MQVSAPAVIMAKHMATVQGSKPPRSLCGDCVSPFNCGLLAVGSVETNVDMGSIRLGCAETASGGSEIIGSVLFEATVCGTIAAE